MKAFYFSNKDKKLRYDDGRNIKVGETHTVDGELELCKNGLHASERLIDALSYAPDSILWLVDVDDNDIIRGGDKLCSRSRTYLAEFDASDVLREFARKQALINIEKIKPYCKSDEDYELIVRFLETGDESLRSDADSAAWSASNSAAWSAAWSAARSAASSAAYSTAYSTASSAAYSTAYSTASSAASSVARSAARSAALSAASSAANEMLTEMIREETGWDI